VACLFALILRQLGFGARAGSEAGAPPLDAAWLAALLFALHPVCVESVAWVSEQKNTLSAAFCLSAALIYLKYADSRPRPCAAGTGSPPVSGCANGPAGRRRLYGLATALFVLALLSKSVTAILPAALLVVLWWKKGRLSWRGDWRPLVPWLALGAAAGLSTAWIESRFIGAQGAPFGLGFAGRCLLAGRATWFYLGKLLWPANLVFVYPRWDVNAGVWWQYLFPAGFAIVLLALWRVSHRARGPLAAALLFAGTLFPALGFVNVYPFVFSYVADHFQYLAGLGIIALAAAAWSRWPGRLLPVAAAAAVVGLLGSLTWRQCGIYRDQMMLYSATLEANPDCWLAHVNLGVVLAQSGRTNEAIAHYREALRLKPDYPEAHNNLGNALLRMGRLDEAAAEYAEALRVRPSFAVAEFDWGDALSDAGRYAEAERHYENAIRLRPDYAEAECKLGSALANAGRLDGAVAHYSRALRLRPDYPEAEANLGLALATEGRPDEALPHLAHAVGLDPGYAEAHAYYGFALARAGRNAEAVEEYRLSLRLHPDNPDAHYQLGVALKALGRLSEAAEEFEAASAPAGERSPAPR
jgi:tetratricopeptide (TPR) repeat protein